MLLFNGYLGNSQTIVPRKFRRPGKLFPEAEGQGQQFPRCSLLPRIRCHQWRWPCDHHTTNSHFGPCCCYGNSYFTSLSYFNICQWTLFIKVYSLRFLLLIFHLLTHCWMVWMIYMTVTSTCSIFRSSRRRLVWFYFWWWWNPSGCCDTVKYLHCLAVCIREPIKKFSFSVWVYIYNITYMVKSLRLLRYSKVFALFGRVYQRAHKEVFLLSVSIYIQYNIHGEITPASAIQ